MKIMKIYVASSWRNEFQPMVVEVLRATGHEVYDFRNPKENDTGFAWSDIDENWEQWTAQEYVNAMKHPIAEDGFKSDFDAMKWADCCVMVLPCGRSANTEAGWMKGAGKKVYVLQLMQQEPELMYKIHDDILTSVHDLQRIFGKKLNSEQTLLAKIEELEETYWHDDMVLRFAELYRWSSTRFTIKAFKDSKDWQSVNIDDAKAEQKRIEELEKENGISNHENKTLRNRIDWQADQITDLQSSLTESEETAAQNRIEYDQLVDKLTEKEEEIAYKTKYYEDKCEMLIRIQTEKEKECEELKSKVNSLKLLNLSDKSDCYIIAKWVVQRFRVKYNAKSKQIEELKAENERLKGLIFNMHSFYKIGEFTTEQIAEQWQDFKKQHNL